MIKKIFKVVIISAIILIVFKGLIFITEPITKKKQLEKINQVKQDVNRQQVLSFIKASEKYCLFQKMDSNSFPSKITNPKEIEVQGKKPDEMNLFFTENCQIKGTLIYGKTVYQYDYETETLKIK